MGEAVAPQAGRQGPSCCRAKLGVVLAAPCQRRQRKLSHSSLQKLSQREGTFPAYQATSSVSSLIYFSSDCS